MTQIFTSISKEEFQDMVQQSVDKAIKKEPDVDPQLKGQSEFLTVQEACSLLRISKPTLYKRVDDGTLSKKVLGHRILFNKAELIASLKNQGGK
jgi:excisionase family DNA binding protein